MPEGWIRRFRMPADCLGEGGVSLLNPETEIGSGSSAQAVGRPAASVSWRSHYGSARIQAGEAASER